jgi:hypothetical protein
MFILMNKRCFLGAVLLSLWLLVLGLSPDLARLAAQDRGLAWNATASTDLVYSFSDGAAFARSGSWQQFAETLQGGFYSGLTTVSLGFQGGDRDSAQLVGLVKFAIPYGSAAALLAQAGSPLAYGLEIAKLYVTVSFPQADLSLGRMIVNYGKGRLFSPSDLFSAVNLQDQALGRVGTDVIRLQLPLSDLAGLDLVSTLALPPAQAVFGGRTFATLSGWDLSAMLFQNGGGLAGLQNGTAGSAGPAEESAEPALLGGFDWKGDLILGFYGEALFAIPYAGYRLVPDRTGYSLALGADYSFGGTWFCTLEYQGNFGQGPRFGQFRADTNLFASLSWKLDEWTSVNSHLIYIVDTTAWQGILSLQRTLMGRTSLSIYSAASRGIVRTAAPLAENTPIGLSFGLTLRAAF